MLLFIFDVVYLHLSSFVNVSSFDFQATLPCHLHSTMAYQACEGLHQLWALPPTAFDCLFFFIYREHYGFEWAFFTHRRFLPYAPSWQFWHNMLLSLKFAGPHTDPRNTDPAHLFIWSTVFQNLLYILNLYLSMLILQKF